MTLDNVKRLKIKPTRYWNEFLVKDVPSDILYSLSDYYPGLPFGANIIRDNEYLHLPKFRIYETVFLQDQGPQVADNVPDEDKPHVRGLMFKEQSTALLAGELCPTQSRYLSKDTSLTLRNTSINTKGTFASGPFWSLNDFLKCKSLA